MMRSMFSGVTGLRNHQIKMDVIGNNIANVNTTGFKKSRATFQDALNQTMRGAAAPQENRGGTNPMQVGLGMTIASIDTIHSPSSMEYTGNMTDMGIEGDGFFIVTDGAQQYYTRAGNFTFDGQGNLVVPGSGLKVMGWQTDNYTVPADKSPQALRDGIRVPRGLMMPPEQTTEVKFAKNLDAGDIIDEANGDKREYNFVLPFKVYDSLGKEHTLYIGFTNEGKVDGESNSYTWKLTIGTGIDENGTITGEVEGKDEGGNEVKLVFGDDGKLRTGDGGGIDKLNVTLLASSDNVTLLASSDSETTDEGQEIILDFSQLTQYAKETSVDVDSWDGYAAGSLLGITTDTAGIITGVFDNGMSRQLGQIALANFDNPGGLIKQGNNLYQYSNNSGEPQIGIAGTAGRGPISPGALEMSNVDLSEEFTQMIITQRGFQANSRIITASDEMLQELVNLKR